MGKAMRANTMYLHTVFARSSNSSKILPRRNAVPVLETPDFNLTAVPLGWTRRSDVHGILVL